MSEANYRTFDTKEQLPEFTIAKWENNELTPGMEQVVKWGLDIPLPDIGTKIRIKVNDFGLGTVRGYFIEANWLGLLVELHNPPKWWLKQMPHRPLAHFFAIEFEPAE